MAYTRAFIRNAAKESGVDLPKELEDALINEHISARDVYAEEKVKTALAENQPAEPVKIKDSDEYKALKSEFETYKADVEGKAARTAKEAAVRNYLESKGIKGNNLTIAMRGLGKEVDASELDDKSALKDTTALDALLEGDYKGLVTTTVEVGAPAPATPPANTGATMTRAEILKKSYQEQAKLYRENPDAYIQIMRGE